MRCHIFDVYHPAVQCEIQYSQGSMITYQVASPCLSALFYTSVSLSCQTKFTLPYSEKKQHNQSSLRQHWHRSGTMYDKHLGFVIGQKFKLPRAVWTSCNAIAIVFLKHKFKHFFIPVSKIVN